MSQMPRVMVYDHADAYIGDLDPAQIVELRSKEEVNGEHCLHVTTLQELERTNRLLVRDGMGVWHEYVVLGLTAEHSVGGAILREYYAVWSVQYDLGATFVDTQVGLVPGHASVPHPPRDGMEAALSGTLRWGIGTITVTTQASGSFYRRSGWEGLQTVVEKWGGELGATIEVGATGVTARRVDLLEHLGASEVVRRFDYGHDVSGIRRTEPDEIWPCRIVPLGKSSETDAGGYTRRPSIATVNDGVMWLQDDEVAPLVRMPAGGGEYDYPTTIIKNDTYEEPVDLKAWALEHITDYTRPRVTYEASVVQFAQAGLNPHGVALGDEVVVVDRTFGDGGLRIRARVTKWEVNLLDPSDIKLTIGNVSPTLAGQLSSIGQDVGRLEEQFTSASEYQSTSSYVGQLIDRLNAELNATGGYFYAIPGIGSRTYDRQVSNPAVGAEATKVVEVGGGSIRIADSRTAQGDWDWKTLIVSGHVASELVTAAQLVTGFIGRPSGDAYWDLDAGKLRIGGATQLGDTTVQQMFQDMNAKVTGVAVEYAQGDSPTQAPTTGWSTSAPAWAEGKYIWSRTATTNDNGTTYSAPVMISGKDGTDGTSVTILGSYNTLAELQAAHPTGSIGDAYMVAGDLYVWNGSAWEDVGQIQGPQGPAGTSVTVSRVEYGVSNSASAMPTSWSTTAPTSIEAGKWLWVRTLYSDGSTAYTKAYSGTNGPQGEQGPQGATGATGPQGPTGPTGATGRGVKSIVPQYYLSTSPTSQTGGSWSNNEPAWVEGKYIWTRSHITWDTTPATSTNTTPVLAQALNGANQAAKDAEKVATNYIEASAADGIVVGDQTQPSLGSNVQIVSDGINLRDGIDHLYELRRDAQRFFVPGYVDPAFSLQVTPTSTTHMVKQFSTYESLYVNMSENATTFQALQGPINISDGLAMITMEIVTTYGTHEFSTVLQGVPRPRANFTVTRADGTQETLYGWRLFYPERTGWLAVAVEVSGGIEVTLYSQMGLNFPVLSCESGSARSYSTVALMTGKLRDRKSVV